MPSALRGSTVAAAKKPVVSERRESSARPDATAKKPATWSAKAQSQKTAAPKAAEKVSAAAGAKAAGPGPVGELERMSAIVVSNSDGYAPTRNLHEAIAKSLPEGAKLVVMQGKEHSDAWHGAAPAGSKRFKTPFGSPWARHFPPPFVPNQQGKLEIVEFKYAYTGADSVAAAMGKKLGIPVTSSKLHLEGGNLLADKGRLFISTKALTANPDLTKAQVEAELKKTLHVDHVEWMTPLPGEPTGHVDMFAKQIAPNTMLVSDTSNPAHKPAMDEAAKKFEALGYKVIRTQNAEVKPNKGQDWPSPHSYANALVVNGTAYVPQYSAPWDKGSSRGRQMDATDRQALSAYASAGLKVVGIPAYDLINFQGSVHCMTNAMPAEVDVSKLK